MIKTKCPICGQDIKSPTKPKEGYSLICPFCKFCIDEVMENKAMWLRFKK